LTPDSQRHANADFHVQNNFDMLNLIFNLLGTPSQDCIEKLERADAKRYVRCFAPREGEALAAKFPHAPAMDLDLLGHLLVFDSTQRLSARAALDFGIFDANGDTPSMREPRLEQTATELIDLAFEAEQELDEPLLRRYFLNDILSSNEDNATSNDETLGVRSL
jgi:mitogen-activated protein kinase 1/3